jgi:hypothetical protein
MKDQFSMRHLFRAAAINARALPSVDRATRRGMAGIATKRTEKLTV